MYKCHACGKQFIGGERIESDQVWSEFLSGKQTLLQLAKKHKCSIRTIQRKLTLHRIKIPRKEPRNIIVLMDTTYWGRGFGVMLFKDAITKENLLKYYVKTETNALYREGVEELKSQGFTIDAIVCDGRRGLIQSFSGVPVQMCQFHQVAIIRRYITKKPRLAASVALKETVSLLKHTDKESFEGALNQWYSEWEDFLKERTINIETGKSHYTHKRLRSAYKSLRNNLPWLFTWYDHIEMKIPNTTNAIDGHFANLKTKLRNHNGLSISNKMKFIDGFLKA